MVRRRAGADRVRGQRRDGEPQQVAKMRRLGGLPFGGTHVPVLACAAECCCGEPTWAWVCFKALLCLQRWGRQELAPLFLCMVNRTR